MKYLMEDIKTGQFKKVYLLCGDEEYLRTQYKQKLRDAVSPPGDTMNQAFFEGKDIDLRAIIDLAETMPFFSDRRYIGVDGSGFFDEKCDELADYIPNMPDTACLVFTETKVDKRSRLYKAVKTHGRIVEFQAQDERTLIRWVLGQIKKENKNITEETLHLFLQRTGDNMANISSELQKLLSYCLDRDVITNADIEAICSGQTEDKVFDMIDLIAEHHQKQALKLYADLLALKIPPLKILSLLERHFNLLMRVRSQLSVGGDANSIASRCGLSPYFVGKKYIPQAKRFDLDVLKEAVKDCVQADEDVKTGRIGDVISVELIIMKYSSKPDMKPAK